MSVDTEKDIFSKFSAAITQMRVLVDSSAVENVTGRVDHSGEFSTVVSEARKLIVEPILANLNVATAEIASLLRWVDPHDILKVRGLSGKEFPYSDLLAWSLNPNTMPQASEHQRAWLESLGLLEQVGDFIAVEPIREHEVSGRSIDLLLHYGHFLVSVEAKTNSSESDIDGRYQTEFYPQELARRHNLPDSQVASVFITTRGTDAKNPTAINTTFADYARLLCRLFNPDDYLEQNARPLSTVLTHFINSNWESRETAAAQLMEVFSLVEAADDEIDAEIVLAKLDDIALVTKFLRGTQKSL